MKLRRSACSSHPRRACALGNFVQIPNQSVDSNGNVTVPYAGAVKAAERTPSEVQQDIIKAIGNRAIEPQAVVALVDQRTSLVSVPGDVNLPSRLQANAAGERLLDAITRAGGPKGPGYETWVTLERAGKRAMVPFGSLIYDQINNIWVHPGDTIYLYREPQVVLVFGATGQQGQSFVRHVEVQSVAGDCGSWLYVSASITRNSRDQR